ncbi:MAG: hypothetical protein ACXWB9_10480 [Flavisolibacter sp.]
MKATFFILLLVTSFNVQAQLRYYTPTHYFGLFYQQLTSAKASGMGRTTITQDGIEVAFYNPASIGPVKEKINLHLNYSSGDPVRPGSKYPFAGISFRINPKLSVGLSTFKWIDNMPVWTTIIGGFNENVDRRTQTMYGANVAYQVIPGLHLGVAGNYLVDKSVPGHTTSSSLLFSAGAIYDRDVSFFKSDKISNQKIRFAASFINLAMKNKISVKYETYRHYRDIPIHAYAGAAYKFSLPLNVPFTTKLKYFDETPKQVDLSVNFQVRDVLAGKEPRTEDHLSNSHFGIGTEAWFFDRVALRIGYYSEKRPSGTSSNGGAWVTQNKAGFTWGYGTRIPVKKLTKNALPIDAELNFVTSKLMGELGKNTTHPSVFTDKKFSFSVGLNLKWVD